MKINNGMLCFNERERSSLEGLSENDHEGRK